MPTLQNRTGQSAEVYHIKKEAVSDLNLPTIIEHSHPVTPMRRLQQRMGYRMASNLRVGIKHSRNISHTHTLFLSLPIWLSLELSLHASSLSLTHTVYTQSQTFLITRHNSCKCCVNCVVHNEQTNPTVHAG